VTDHSGLRGGNFDAESASALPGAQFPNAVSLPASLRVSPKAVLPSLLKVTATEVAVVQDAELVGVATDVAFVTSVEEAAAVEGAADIKVATDDEETTTATAVELATDVELLSDDEIAAAVRLELADLEAFVDVALAVEVALVGEVATVAVAVAEADALDLELKGPVIEEQMPLPVKRDFGKKTPGSPLDNVTARFPLESVVTSVQLMTSMRAWLELKPVSVEDRVRLELPLAPLLVKALIIWKPVFPFLITMF